MPWGRKVKRTTKILLAVAGIAVLSYPGLAWVSGIAIEGQIQHGEQQALDKTPYLVLVKREYHRGVYRSTEIATYSWRNPALRSAGWSALFAPGTITVVSNIQHGPLPGLHTAALGVIESAVIAPPALQKALAGALGSRPILDLHSQIGFLGGATGDLTSPGFSVRLPDGAALTWGGLTASGTATRNQARWSGQLNLPRLTLLGPQGAFELAGLAYTGSHTKALDDLYVGTGMLTIERIDGRTARGQFAVDRISLISTSKAAGDFLDMRIDTSADAARIAAVSLKNLTYSVSFEHVHGPSLNAMTQQVRAAQRQTGLSPMQLQAGLQDALRQYGGELLLHDPVIDIRQIGFSMPEGSFNFSARLRAPGLSAADLQSLAAAIMALRTHAQITADLRVDNGLLQKVLAMGGSNPKIAAQLTSLEQQGYLTAASTALTTHVEYSSGRLTLNSHPFPPAASTN
jgi:uncharacterized protein YdgA (DUF945 family)